MRDKVLNMGIVRCCSMVSLQAILKWCRLQLLTHTAFPDKTSKSELINAKHKRWCPRLHFTDVCQSETLWD